MRRLRTESERGDGGDDQRPRGKETGKREETSGVASHFLSLSLSWLVRGCGVNYEILWAVNGVFD
jgi:hypothetical protein